MSEHTYNVVAVEHSDRSALGLRHCRSQLVPPDASLHPLNIMCFQAGLQHLTQLLYFLVCHPDQPHHLQYTDGIRYRGFFAFRYNAAITTVQPAKLPGAVLQYCARLCVVCHIQCSLAAAVFLLQLFSGMN